MQITGKDVAIIREHYGLSQKRFAQKLKVSTGSITAWENGKVKPTNKKVVKKLGHLKAKVFFKPGEKTTAPTRAFVRSETKITQELNQIKTVIEGFQGLGTSGQRFVTEYLGTTTIN